MDGELVRQFQDLMFETCRNQMDEVKNFNGADAGEKMRRCFNKFYILTRHQSNYFGSLSEKQFEDILNS